MSVAHVPSLADFPEFVAETQRLGEINLAAREAEEEIQRLRAIRPRFDSDDAVRAVLEGRDVPPSQSPTAWRSRLEELHERVELLKQAGRRQQEKIREVRVEVANRVVEDLRPYYAELQQRMAKAVLALGVLADEETAFRERLQDAGIAADTLRPNPLPRMRLAVSDNGSEALGFLDRAEKHHGVKVKK